MNATLPPSLLIETEGVPTSRPGIPLGVMVRLMVSEVVDDEKLVEEQPDYGLLLSWHLADSIIPKIRKSGFKGKIIVGLPEPKIL